MKSSDITLTDARLKNAFKQVNNIVSEDENNKKIADATNQAKIQLGEVTKFYPTLDKAEVKLKNNKFVICKILHKCWGSVIDFFTPAGDRDYCKKFKEPYIAPMFPMPCAIADVNDSTKEYLLLGYYANHRIVGINPAKEGEFRIIGVGDNEYHVSFDGTVFDVATVEGISITEKSWEESQSVEYYTKSEVDKMLEDLRNELGGN